MTVAELKDSLCEDLIVGAFERHGREFLATRFTYPVGDSVNLYLVENEGGQQRISDLGTTHYFLQVVNVDMDTDARMDFVKSVCAGFEIEFGSDFSLSKPITTKTAGDDVLTICQAITRISALHYDEKAKQFQTFVKEVDILVSTMFPHHVYRGWTDPIIDPQSNYPIDYHFNGQHPARNMFVVRSRLSAETAIGTMNFYLAKSRLDPSMTVVAPDLSLPRKVEKKLELNSRVIFGINETQISQFARLES